MQNIIHEFLSIVKKRVSWNRREETGPWEAPEKQPKGLANLEYKLET